MSTIGYGRSSALETYVRGHWYKIYATLEDDYLCISLDETYENCTPVNGSLNNNTLGKTILFTTFTIALLFISHVKIKAIRFILKIIPTYMGRL